LKKDTSQDINPKKMVQRKKPQTNDAFNSNKASSSKDKDQNIEMPDFSDLMNAAEFNDKEQLENDAG
jgi:hypothetical protein